jgi:hypothetical protein
MNKYIIASLIIIILIFFTLFLKCDFESPEEVYSDYNTAIESEIFGDGKWVPVSLLPSSAKNIHVKYDIDSNEVWLLFDYDSISSLNIKSICLRILIRKEMLPRYNRSAEISWWPSSITNQTGYSKMDEEFVFYNCMAIYDGMVAIDAKRKKFYYWSLAR